MLDGRGHKANHTLTTVITLSNVNLTYPFAHPRLVCFPPRFRSIAAEYIRLLFFNTLSLICIPRLFRWYNTFRFWVVWYTGAVRDVQARGSLGGDDRAKSELRGNGESIEYLGDIRDAFCSSSERLCSSCFADGYTCFACFFFFLPGMSCLVWRGGSRETF